VGADSDRSLAGRNVVITGAAGGIGSALAGRFAGAGARVALLDLDGEAAEALAGELRSAGSEALGRGCDVTSLADVRAAIDFVCGHWGGVDVLVANAGITHLSPFRDTDVDVLRRVMEVNFFGAVHCAQAALESLVSRRGRIVVLSSVAGFAPLATRTGYAASKHALHGFFESLRVELHATGVTVTMVCPFFVRTAIGDHALGGDGGAPRVARTQTGRSMEPEQLADQIYRATAARRRLLLASGGARLARLLSRLAPALYERIMRRRLAADV
jgi:NAD(P)-dependent dehydrogenase (short-subunit alcohol dehydrogenase family)